jgi:hypothetical protein
MALLCIQWLVLNVNKCMCVNVAPGSAADAVFGTPISLFSPPRLSSNTVSLITLGIYPGVCSPAHPFPSASVYDLLVLLRSQHPGPQARFHSTTGNNLTLSSSACHATPRPASLLLIRRLARANRCVPSSPAWHKSNAFRSSNSVAIPLVPGHSLHRFSQRDRTARYDQGGVTFKMRRSLVVKLLVSGALAAAVPGGGQRKRLSDFLSQMPSAEQQLISCEETYGNGWETCGDQVCLFVVGFEGVRLLKGRPGQHIVL